IPVPLRRGLLGHPPWRPLLGVPPIPRVERGAVDPELRQRAAHGQLRAFNQADHLRLLGRRQPHVSSSELEPRRLFLSSRFSSTLSARACLSRVSSRRSPCTSGAVASRVVSPSNRFFPASRNSLLQR